MGMGAYFAGLIQAASRYNKNNLAGGPIYLTPCEFDLVIFQGASKNVRFRRLLKKLKKLSMITVKIFLILILLSMVGCTAQATAAPTADPQVFASTVSAAKTQAVEAVFVQLTRSAVPTQTLTDIPQPTQAPSLTPTSIPEFTQTSTAVPTRAATAVPTQGEYQCSITAIEPKYGAAMASGSDFDLIVTVKNTGTEKWVKDNIDFKYLSGVTLQKKVDAIDLPANVDPGDSIELRVDMTARSESGAQAAVWGLVRSSTAFCTVGINIVVQ